MRGGGANDSALSASDESIMSGSSGMSSLLPRSSELTSSNSESVRDIMYDGDEGAVWHRESRECIESGVGATSRGVYKEVKRSTGLVVVLSAASHK